MTAKAINRSDVIELAKVLGVHFPTETESVRELWDECLARGRSLRRERCTNHRWGAGHSCTVCGINADRLAASLPGVVLVQVARAAAGGELLDELPKEIGLWLEDSARNGECHHDPVDVGTIRAIGRLLGIDMG